MPKKASPILRLLFEVRLKVYLVMHSWPSKPCHAIFCASKQLLSEARESYHQRGLICSSEIDFVSVVDKGPPLVLNKIQTPAINCEHRAFLKREACCSRGCMKRVMLFVPAENRTWKVFRL